MAAIFDAPLAALRFAHAGASPLGWREAPVNECLLYVKVALVVKRLGKDGEDVLQHADGPTAETAGDRFDTTDSDPAGLPTVLRSSGSDAIEHPHGSPSTGALDRLRGAPARARSAR